MTEGFGPRISGLTFEGLGALDELHLHRNFCTLSTSIVVFCLPNSAMDPEARSFSFFLANSIDFSLLLPCTS